MKTRIITGVVLGVIALCVLLFFPVWAIRLVAALICCLAMYELLTAGACKHKGLITAAFVFAAACPFLDLLDGFKLVWAALMAYAFVLALMQLIANDTLPLEQTLYVFCASAMIVLPVSSLAYIRAVPEHGLAYLFLALIIPCFSDMGAYFAGSFLGKHKLCPHISPKKTVEGLLGGIVSAVVFSLIGAWIYQLLVLDGTGQQVTYWLVALIALVASPISVVGDLFCSVIKRSRGIKDFGHLFPGHGGILDRFDSMTYVVPFLYAAVLHLPLIQ